MGRILEKVLSGRFIILIAFGLTICLLANACLMALISLAGFGKEKDPSLLKEIIPILKDVLLFLLGAVSTNFSKIWDSYNYRTDRKPQGGKDEEVISNVTIVKPSETGTGGTN